MGKLGGWDKLLNWSLRVKAIARTTLLFIRRGFCMCSGKAGIKIVLELCFQQKGYLLLKFN